MSRLFKVALNNLAPKAMVFEMPQAARVAPVVSRLSDGSVIMDAVPLIAGQDMIYYGYELPIEEMFGVDPYADNATIKWDTSLTGRLTIEAAQGTLDQFEGLAVTDGHTFVETGKRDEVAVGAFLCNGTLDGDKVRTRALLYVASAIVKAETNSSELSIGGDAFLEVNPSRAMAGEPDFFIRRIDLNHVALVENGRAGPEARLLNHKASLSHNPPKENGQMKTIIIAGVAHEVPDAVADDFARINTAHTDLANTNATLTNQVSSLTTERDAALGRADELQTQLSAARTEIANNTPDVPALAVQMANEHASFVEAARTLGHTDELVLGAYDRVAVMTAVLNTRGKAVPEGASADYLNARWDAAVEAVGNNTQSVIDNAKPIAVSIANVAEGATAAVNASYFGSPKKKEA